VPHNSPRYILVLKKNWLESASPDAARANFPSRPGSISKNTKMDQGLCVTALLFTALL